MTDETGILQFSRLDNPDKNSGYTLDDNARALMVAVLNDFKYDEILQYTLFLHSAQQQDGSWSNFYQGNIYSSRFDSEDSIGRALMACAAGTFSKWDNIRQLCEEMFIKNIDKAMRFNSPRAIAYSLLGLCKISSSENEHKNNYNLIIDRLSNYLLGLYETYHGPRWYWFENYLTYCNGILPQALLAVYNLSGSKKALKAGRDSLDFLCGILFRYGHLNIIGNQGWYQRGQRVAMFDQQPVDAASIVIALNEGYTAIGRREYLEMAQKGYLWYLGDNIHAMSLYNPQTGGCFDALTPAGVNGNQGAEAVLSLLLTELVISQQQQLNREISI
jgi:hypothetical protein